MHRHDYANDEPAVEDQVGASPYTHQMSHLIGALWEGHKVYAAQRHDRDRVAQEPRSLSLNDSVEERQQQAGYQDDLDDHFFNLATNKSARMLMALLSLCPLRSEYSV